MSDETTSNRVFAGLIGSLEILMFDTLFLKTFINFVENNEYNFNVSSCRM